MNEDFLFLIVEVGRRSEINIRRSTIINQMRRGIGRDGPPGRPGEWIADESLGLVPATAHFLRFAGLLLNLNVSLRGRGPIRALP